MSSPTSLTGADLRKRTFHRGRAKPNGAGASVTSFGHTAHNRLDTTSSIKRREFTPACVPSPSRAALQKRTFHRGRAKPNGAGTSAFGHTARNRLDTTSSIKHRARHAEFTPACSFPQSHSLAETHFPPRPGKTASATLQLQTSFARTVGETD